MNYEIHPYSPELKDQILKLQTHLWSPDLAMNAAYFDWKYHQNPYSDSPLIYLALQSGQVVGMRGLMGAAWQTREGGQPFVVPCAADVVIHPQHRNQGLFEQLTQAALQEAANRGYPYALNLSAGRVTTISLLGLGWRSAGRIHIMQWCNPTRKAPTTLTGRGIRFLKRKALGEPHVFHSLDSHEGKRSLGTVGSITIQKTPRPKEMCELAVRVKGVQGLRHKVEPHYYAWRFQNPLAGYRFLFWNDARLEGFLVLQTSVNQTRKWIALVDWEAANEQIWSDLVKAAIDLGQFNELRIWSNNLPEEAKTILFDLGFLDLNEQASLKLNPPTILVTPTAEGLDPQEWALGGRSLLDLTQWNLRMIFSDNY